MEDPLPVFFDIAGNTFYFSCEKLAMENLSDSDSESVLQDYHTPQAKGGLSGDVLVCLTRVLEFFECGKGKKRCA